MLMMTLCFTGEREVGTQDKLLLLATEGRHLVGVGLQSRKKVNEQKVDVSNNFILFLLGCELQGMISERFTMHHKMGILRRIINGYRKNLQHIVNLWCVQCSRNVRMGLQDNKHRKWNTPQISCTYLFRSVRLNSESKLTKLKNNSSTFYTSAFAFLTPSELLDLNIA